MPERHEDEEVTKHDKKAGACRIKPKVIADWHPVFKQVIVDDGRHKYCNHNIEGHHKARCIRARLAAEKIAKR